MRSSSYGLVALVLSLSPILISLTACGRSPNQRIFDAGTIDGQTRAGVAAKLPDWCHQAVPHAAKTLGMEALVHDKLEGNQLDVANRQKLQCVIIGESMIAAVQVTGEAAR